MNFIVAVSTLLNRLLQLFCRIIYTPSFSYFVGEILLDNSQLENTIIDIRKRSGAVTAFNKDKISNAIFGALTATSKADRGLADQLAGNVVDKLVEQGFTSSRVPTVEDIQDIVESTLIDSVIMIL